MQQEARARLLYFSFLCPPTVETHGTSFVTWKESFYDVLAIKSTPRIVKNAILRNGEDHAKGGAEFNKSGRRVNHKNFLQDSYGLEEENKQIC